MAHRLEPLLAPRSIAVVGASPDAGRIGGMPLDLLTQFGYRGAIYPVNPKYKEVFGLACAPDVESLPEVPDLAVLAIGAAEVTPMLARCHARGIRAAIVYAAGFAEAGQAGAALQRGLEAFVARSGMIVAGPNCMGFANLNTAAYTAFASVFKAWPVSGRRGRVSLLTQSGNVCAAVYAIARRLGVDFSHFINTGNEATLEFAQYLDYLAADPQTEVVLGYVEQLRSGPAFIAAAEAMRAAGKMLVVMKAGESEKGAEAVRSHTSALAGDMALYHAAFAQLNVIEANDFAQMADLAMLAGERHRTAGRRVAIVTMSGALGAILADKFLAAGLDVPTLPEPLQATLRNGIPDYGMVSNPVDVTGNVVNQPGFVRTALDALARSEGIDCVVVYAPGYLLDRMSDDLCAVAADHPRLMVAIDTGKANGRERLAAGGVPVFEDIGRAVNALAPYLRWVDGRAQAARWSALRNGVAPGPRIDDPGRDEHTVKRTLARFGLAPVPERVARDADEAVAAADALGYPVVLKVLSPDIAHKTEADAVRLHLADAHAVRQAFETVCANARRHAPAARIDGALVQAMMRGVAELIVGATRDPVFGWSLTVGLGGILTELYRDVSHRVLPVDRAMAREMLGELRAFPLLAGHRGRPPADLDALCTAVAAMSDAALAMPGHVTELEVNPLLACEEGAFMLDALALSGSDPALHQKTAPARHTLSTQET